MGMSNTKAFRLRSRYYLDNCSCAIEHNTQAHNMPSPGILTNGKVGAPNPPDSSCGAPSEPGARGRGTVVVE